MSKDLANRNEQRELEGLLQALAAEVRRRKLEVPAVFFLEAYKPLTSLFHSMAVMGGPVLNICFGPRLSRVAEGLLASRANVEALICAVEGKA